MLFLRLFILILVLRLVQADVGFAARREFGFVRDRREDRFQYLFVVHLETRHALHLRVGVVELHRQVAVLLPDEKGGQRVDARAAEHGGRRRAARLRVGVGGGDRLVRNRDVFLLHLVAEDQALALVVEVERAGLF